jgi:hypothetical protein
MIDTLITSKTRIKLLTRLFLNPETSGYLRGLEAEFGESSNAIRLELNRFEDAGLLISAKEGHRKVFRANTTHPLYNDINSILLKTLGIDHIIEKVIKAIGHLHSVYLTGDYANGITGGDINMLFAGEALDIKYLNKLIHKAEKLINCKIKYTISGQEQLADFLRGRPKNEFLLLWKNEDEK